MVYDAMLLTGVLFIAGWLFSTLLQERQSPYLRIAFQDWLVLVMGLYFVWFWSHGGQTLAMKTWHIRLVTADGQAVSIKRAIGRYILAWLWILPGLALAWALGARNWMLILIPSANIVVWSAAIYLHPQRQFLHDRLAGTRLVNKSSSPKRNKPYNQ
jgi:uncharacterized RDD family membrane protein YckC